MSITKWGVTVTVEIALSAATSVYGVWNTAVWNTSLWGPDVVWTDVSAYVRSWRTGGKFSREIGTWTAGTATVVLDNRNGRFSPDNMGGPYVSAGVTQIRPLRPIRITAAYAGVSYDVWYGYVLDWLETWTGGAPGEGDAIVTLPCADEFTRFAGVDGLEVSPVGAGELSGARVHRVLDAAGHTGARNIDVGEATLAATTLAESTLGELEKVVKAEGGALYVDGAGAVVFEGQYALIENARSVESQATFADDGTGLRYADAATTYGADLVVNIAAYTADGGTVQIASDATSRALYGDRRRTEPDLLCETDAQALSLAQWQVQQYKDPERRFTKLAIKPRRDPTTLWPQVLGRLIRDQITVIRNPPGGFAITQACHIAGISHEVDANNWVTTFDLWSASLYAQYAASRWDVGVWGSSETDDAGAKWFF